MLPRSGYIDRMSEPSIEEKLRALSVLVVDDHEINREFLRTGLTRIVGHLDAVDSGPAAIECCRTRAYDVILMDLHMPHMDGLATATRIRDLGGPASRTRMLVLTADARPEERERLLEAGFDDYLNKPMGIAELTEALARLIAPVDSGQAPLADRRSRGARLVDFQRACVAANGDAATARRLSHMLGEELGSKLPVLDAWLAAGRHEQASTLLHQWAGASGFAGATRFSHACRNLRQRLSAAHSSSPGTAYADFLRTAHATREALLTATPDADLS